MFNCAKIKTHLDNSSIILTSLWASYSFCSSVISSIGFGIGCSMWPVIGLILKNTNHGHCQRNAGMQKEKHDTVQKLLPILRKQEQELCIHIRVLTMVWLTCTPLCQSFHQMSTVSLLCLRPATLVPSTVPQHCHNQCTSTDYPLHHMINERKWCAKK